MRRGKERGGRGECFGGENEREQGRDTRVVMGLFISVYVAARITTYSSGGGGAAAAGNGEEEERESGKREKQEERDESFVPVGDVFGTGVCIAGVGRCGGRLA
ncbi:hypothetical protein AgCh_005057 [Apium graveolens]